MWPSLFIVRVFKLSYRCYNLAQSDPNKLKTFGANNFGPKFGTSKLTIRQPASPLRLAVTCREHLLNTPTKSFSLSSLITKQTLFNFLQSNRRPRKCFDSISCDTYLFRKAFSTSFTYTPFTCYRAKGFST